MTNEELYSYYINMADFLESPTGKQFLSLLLGEKLQEETALREKFIKIQTAKEYTDMQEQFLTNKAKLNAFNQIILNHLNLEAIKLSIKKLKEKIA